MVHAHAVLNGAFGLELASCTLSAKPPKPRNCAQACLATGSSSTRDRAPHAVCVAHTLRTTDRSGLPGMAESSALAQRRAPRA